MRLLAVCLSALAGYVDATGFIRLGGFFVSFMSGNSTRLAVGLAQGSMAAENAVFEKDGEVQIGLTYMTGTLVKMGQRITPALLGGDRLGWVPYLYLWLGLIAGAVLGALDYPILGLNRLWIAAVYALVCAMAATLLERRTVQGDVRPS